VRSPSSARAENAGTEYVFGVQGGAIMPVYDALYDSDMTPRDDGPRTGSLSRRGRLRHRLRRNRRLFRDVRAGRDQPVTGIADANMDSIPMIALTGQVPTDFVGNDAFQETDTVGISQPVTKHNYFADDADTVGDDVSEAFALADEGRQGPTLVDLPKDVTQGRDRRPAREAESARHVPTRPKSRRRERPGGRRRARPRTDQSSCLAAA